MNDKEHYIPFRCWDSFVQVPSPLLKYPHLSPMAKLMFGLLARYAGKDGLANPSQRRLASDLGCTDRHVRGVLSELEASGFIERARGNHARTRYAFVIHPALKVNAPQSQASGTIVPVDAEESFRTNEEQSFRSDAEGSFPLKEDSFSEKKEKESREEEKSNTAEFNSLPYQEQDKANREHASPLGGGSRKRRSTITYPPEFESFWAEYKIHGCKGDSRKANGYKQPSLESWQRCIEAGATTSVLIEQLRKDGGELRVIEKSPLAWLRDIRGGITGDTYATEKAEYDTLPSPAPHHGNVLDPGPGATFSP